MIIYQQFKGEKKVTIVTEETFLRRTEGSGYWKEGTALRTLREVGGLQTPFTYYTINSTFLTQDLSQNNSQ